MIRAAALREWIAARRDEAPDALVARVEEVFAAHPLWGELAWPEAFAAAGEHLLAGVQTAGVDAARASAVDLLAADACVTWAFEAAAEDPETLGARADAAMRRIAALAT